MKALFTFLITMDDEEGPEEEFTYTEQRLPVFVFRNQEPEVIRQKLHAEIDKALNGWTVGTAQ